MSSDQDKNNVVQKQAYGSPEIVCLGDAVRLTAGGGGPEAESGPLGGYWSGPDLPDPNPPDPPQPPEPD